MVGGNGRRFDLLLVRARGGTDVNGLIGISQIICVQSEVHGRPRVFYTRSGTTLAVAMAIQVILQSNADGTALVPAFDGGKGPMPWIAVFEGRRGKAAPHGFGRTALRTA